MIISQKNKIAYIGMPHTGSTLIHNHCKNFQHLIVDDNIYKHASVATCLDLGAQDDYSFFIFVRNPIDWMKSKWAMMHRMTLVDQSYIDKQTCQEWKQRCINFRQENPDIDKFILKLLSGDRVSVFDRYIDFPCDITYLKYENFKSSCELLFKKLEVPTPDLSKKVNSSDGINLDIKKETEQKIISRFYNDMLKFGYLENK